jgi:transposase
MAQMGLGRTALVPLERKELERRARSRSLAAESVRRARVILMLATGSSYKEICQRLGCAVHYISRLKKRYEEEGLGGLDPRFPEAGRGRRTAQTEARILEWTRREPTDGSTHWSSYRLAKEVGVSQSTVSRVWRKFGLPADGSRRYVAREDPEFAEKAADIIGLYLKSPVHAAVFCVGERSAMQGLDRLDPIFPSSPGGADGTLSLYRGLSNPTEELLAENAAPDTSVDFVDFLAQIVVSQPTVHEIHVIADNLSAGKTKEVCQFFEANPTVRIHSTPTYFSWIHQVEIWLSKIQRDLISRGVFTSVKEFAPKLIRSIRKYNKSATTIRWIY